MVVSDFAVDLEVIGNHVILGDFHNGLQVIDVSDPMHPFLSGYHTDAFGGEGSNLAGLTVAGHLVYTTQGVSLGIYDISAALGASSQPEPLPQSFALYPAYPNPFNPSTTISFDLPQTSPVRLDVFDIQGRLVSTLIDHPLSAGHHVTNVNAESWPSGMYLCRLRSGAFTATQKLLLLK